MKSEIILKKVNEILDLNDKFLMTEKLKQLKDDLEVELLQEINCSKNPTLKTVAKACLDILNNKNIKSKSVLQKAIYYKEGTALTDSFRIVYFKDKKYVNIPIHNDIDAYTYPNLDSIINGIEKTSQEGIEIKVNIDEIEKKYKLFKTLSKKEKEKVENILYCINEEKQVYCNIEYLKSILDIFTIEKEFEVYIAKSNPNVKPITFINDNITAALIPCRYYKNND